MTILGDTFAEFLKESSNDKRKWTKKSLAITYFPTPSRGSIIGVGGLDFRVRNGNGYDSSTMITRQ